MWGCGFGAMTLAVRPRHFSPAQVSGLSAWYDPSDQKTLFQDEAMTVPVTEPGQSVAAMRDKSGNGRHMVQAVSAARPVFGLEPVTGRRNLLTRTEDIGGAGWGSGTAGIVYNGGQIIQETTAASLHRAMQTVSAQTGSGKTFTLSALVRRAIGTRNLDFGLVAAGASGYVTFFVDLGSGNVMAPNHNLSGALSNPAISVAPEGGYWRVILSASVQSGTGVQVLLGMVNGGSSTTHNSYAGDGVSQLEVLELQLEAGSVRTAYQKVVTPYQVTEAGVAPRACLSFDGVDDVLTTPVKPVAGTSVFAGVAFAPNAGFPTSTSGGVFADAQHASGGVQLGWEGVRQSIISNDLVGQNQSQLIDFSADAQRRNLQGIFTGPSPFGYLRDAGFIAAASSYASSTTQPLSLGRGTQGGRTGFFAGRFYGAAYAGANRAEAEALLGWLGRTCGLSV